MYVHHLDLVNDAADDASRLLIFNIIVFLKVFSLSPARATDPEFRVSAARVSSRGESRQGAEYDSHDPGGADLFDHRLSFERPNETDPVCVVVLRCEFLALRFLPGVPRCA